MSNIKCTRCGKPGAGPAYGTQADQIHTFHPKCLEAHKKWMAGHEGPEDVPCKSKYCLVCPP